MEGIATHTECTISSKQTSFHAVLYYVQFTPSDLALNWMSCDKGGYLSEAIHAVLTMEDT